MDIITARLISGTYEHILLLFRYGLVEYFFDYLF